MTSQQAAPEPTRVQTDDEQPILRLRQKAPVEDENVHVTWDPSVINNEFCNQRTSKCCCIYVKPRKWDDPSESEESEDETEHCRGHVEVRGTKLKVTPKSMPIGTQLKIVPKPAKQ